MAADLTDRQHKELKRQKDQGRIAYYRNGRLCFKEKRRSSRRGSPAGHDRRQHERMRQRQHHDHPEHSREHERTPDNTPPPTVDMNEYPALQGQQVPPTDHQQLQTMETQGPVAASTPGLPKSAHATSGQILEEHWVPDNGSGVSANDNEHQMVITADVDHNADAEITHDTSLEDTGSAEGGTHNDHGDPHVFRNQSSSDDHHAPHDQIPSGDHHAPHDQSPSGDHHAPHDQIPSGDHRASRDQSPSGDHHASRDQIPSGDHHASRDQSPSGDHHASRDQIPSGDHPLHISEVPEGAQGAPTTVASPYGQERNANLSPAADQTPAESPDIPLRDSQTSVKQAPLSLPGESPSDIESQSPMNPETMNRDRDGQSPTGRGVCAEVSHSSSLHLSFENETVRQGVGRGPQTRSKATSRQIRLTDCFSRAAAGAGKEKRADGQRGLEPHSATDSAS